MRKSIVALATCGALLWTQPTMGATAQDKCQAGKNQAAGKYAACRHSAEKKLAVTGDTARYNDGIAKCEATFAAAWQKEEDRAAGASATCLDAPLLEGDFKAAINAHTDIIATALEGGGLIDCPSDLATCTGDLGTCSASLSSCSVNYASCSSDLTTCTANCASCSSSVATCSAGTATGADVIAGKTFSSSAGIGSTGTMPNNGAVSITPSAATQAILRERTEEMAGWR